MAISSDSAFVDVSIRYKIQGLDEGARSAQRAHDSMARFGRILSQVGQSLIAFKAVDLLVTSINKMSSAIIEANSLFEKAQIQLEVFTGSAVQASRTIDFLAFESTKLAGGLEDLLQGATALETFGLNTQENIKLIADVAQATNRAIEDVAIAFGRIVIGDPRTKQFLTTRRGDVIAFNNAIAEGKTRLEAARLAFERFNGVSERLEGSFARLSENISDLFVQIAKFVGEPTFLILEKNLQDFVDFLRKEVFDESGKMKTEGTIFDTLRNGITASTNALQLLIEVMKEWEKVRERTKGIPTILGGNVFPQDWENDIIARAFGQNPPSIGGGGKSGDVIDNGVFNFRVNPEMLSQQEQRAAEAVRKAQREQEMNVKARKMLWDLDAKKYKDQIEERKRREKEIADFTTRLNIDYAQARLDAIDIIYDHEIARLGMFGDAQKRIQENEVKIREEAQESIIKKEEDRIRRISRISDEIVSRGGFLLFGGIGANRQIDKQVEAIQKEIDVLNGVTTPLTQQEQLLNRIVELEAQRITLADRLRTTTLGILGDLAEAAAKAAILTGLNRGRGGFGFGDFLKAGLGLASIIPSPFQAAAIVGGIGINLGPNPLGLKGTIPGTLPANKPAVAMFNPIFLSEDLPSIVNSAQDAAKRRVV